MILLFKRIISSALMERVFSLASSFVDTPCSLGDYSDFLARTEVLENTVSLSQENDESNMPHGGPVDRAGA